MSYSDVSLAIGGGLSGPGEAADLAARARAAGMRLPRSDAGGCDSATAPRTSWPLHSQPMATSSENGTQTSATP